MQSQQSQKSHLERVAALLRLEAGAIRDAAERLNGESINHAAELILKTEGKVVVMGVGKSGVIAQKIAQTMTSTGTVAIFLHPSDAMHGSLGIVSSSDVVIALSNSGETEELLAIIPTLRQRGVPVVSIVGKTASSLAAHSDVFLDASVASEACPLNLAPTASTTVALALGDALAMSVMESRGLTVEDFAANHPAGQLGKRLTIRVRDLMHASPNVAAENGWLDVVKAISKSALGAVNVVDADGKLIGIVTDGDLRRTIERTDPQSLAALNAAAMMTRSPVTTTSDLLAFEALRMMEDRPSQISVLPVVDNNGRCIGLLRLHDIVRSGL